jgi:LPS sulfotransferase NodH
MTQPDICYTIWFRQRQGSTMLGDLLQNTGIAGLPGEWIGSYRETPDLLALHDCQGLAELQEKLWTRGTTENKVFGAKVSFMGSPFGRMMDSLKTSQSMPQDLSEMDVWEQIFPNHRHIHLIRRNKLRQAISWWKAIQTGISHRTATGILRGRHCVANPTEGPDLEDRYDFNAIMHLIGEVVANESELQEAFTHSEITPLTIIYEDLVADIPGGVHRILEHIGVSDRPRVEKPRYQRLSDDLSERWYQRLLDDLSGNWSANVEQAHAEPTSEAARCAAPEEADA